MEKVKGSKILSISLQLRRMLNTDEPVYNEWFTQSNKRCGIHTLRCKIVVLTSTKVPISSLVLKLNIIEEKLYSVTWVSTWVCETVGSCLEKCPSSDCAFLLQLCWNVCVRERVAVVAERMPLEVCPGNRKTEQGRNRRMPNHFGTSMQNTQLADSGPRSCAWFERKLGPARFKCRIPHMPKEAATRYLLVTLYT